MSGRLCIVRPMTNPYSNNEAHDRNGGYPDNGGAPYGYRDPSAHSWNGSGGYGGASYGEASYGQPGFDQQRSPATPPQYAQPQYQGAPSYDRPVQQPRSWVIAVLLCLFLGGFGAHSFYLGYTKRGLFQLGLNLLGWFTSVLFIGMIFLIVLGFWVLADLIMVLTRSGRFRTDADGVWLQR